MGPLARDLMHPDLTAVMESDLVHDAVHILYSHNITGLPVIREDWKLVGFISESDILKAAVPTYLEVLAQSSFLADEECTFLNRFVELGKATVADYMNSVPISLEPSSSLMSVADLMLRKKIKRIPVTEEGRLVGIIDRGAFCEFLMEADFVDLSGKNDYNQAE